MTLARTAAVLCAVASSAGLIAAPSDDGQFSGSLDHRAIDTAAFDRLPPVAKQAVYRRMWAILSGDDRSTRYRRLSLEDRRAIVEILGDTKRDLPAFFKRATHDVLN